jgi:glucosylceramidase
MASKYISGIAVHWYLDSIINPNVLDFTHAKFPDKWIFATEACTGQGPIVKHVILGSFQRGESYARDIIEVI